MESIGELRQKLQTNVLGHPILQRVLSIYITRAILSTRMSANQVTVLMLLVGVASAIPLFLGQLWWGLALSYLCILLDASDGEVARYRGTYSLRGIYLDLINHLAIQPWFFLVLGYAVAQTQSGWVGWVVLAAAAAGALSMSLRRANADLHRIIYMRHYRAHPEYYALPPVLAGAAEFMEVPASGSSLVALLKKAIYVSEYHAVMLIEIVVALVAEMLLFPGRTDHPVLLWLIIFHVVLSCAYLIKEIVSSYREMDGRVASVAQKFSNNE